MANTFDFEDRNTSQSISDAFAPVRRQLGGAFDAPMGLASYLQDMAAAGGYGLYGAASDVSGLGASALGFPETGQSLFDLADRSYGRAGEFVDESTDYLFPEIEDYLTEEAKVPESTARMSPEMYTQITGQELPGTTPLTDFETSDADDIQSYLDSIDEQLVMPQPVTPDSMTGEDAVMSMPVSPARMSDEDTVMSQPVKAADSEQMFVSAMQDFIQEARGTGPDAKAPKDLEEYKKEFAEATGIDISGKPDKSSALMAFGLALMQNKAGKGFNVGKMLSSVGVAGAAALPALEKAKQQARQDGIAAGKYALEMRSADETKAAAAREKAMARQDYYVVPRSDDVTGFLAGIGQGQGRLESLSKYEVDKLLKNPEFASKFDILPGSTWGTVVKEALKTPEAKELYQAKPRAVKLFEGTDAELSFQVYDPTANASRQGVQSFTYQANEAYDKIADQVKDLEKAESQWADITAQIQDRGVNVFTQTVDGADALFEAFGINFREGETPTARMKNFLTRVQMQNAPEILGEAGKTISDADRERVAQIVGDVGLLTSQDELLAKMEQVHKFIVGRTRTNIMRNLREVDRYSGGSNFSEYLQGDEGLTEDQKERLAAYNKRYGFTGG